MNYLNKETCKSCAGKCCKFMPGSCAPEDIINNFPSSSLKKSVSKALATGKYSIDCWEDSQSIYYVRPATTDKVGKTYDFSWGGKCIFLTIKGCKLTNEKRPYQCRMLKPSKNSGCKGQNKSGKYEMACKWRKTKLDLSNFKK